MGGYGSGQRDSKKRTVEGSLIFPVADYLRRALSYGPGTTGTSHWTRTGEEDPFASISWAIERYGAGLAVRLIYTKTCRGVKKSLDYPVPVVSTTPHFGGRRWHFLCPLLDNGRPCMRRVSKLYLPPGGPYFGCRECHDLTYTSCQESHQFDGMFMELARGMIAKGLPAGLGEWAVKDVAANIKRTLGKPGRL